MSLEKKLQIVDIPLDRIDANPHQPRQRFTQESLEELAASIRDKGVLQPIIVRPVGEGEAVRYTLIAGERRARASKLADRATIPAIVLAVDADEGVEMALLENIQREDLGVVEEARALCGLADRYGGSVEQVAMKVHKSIGYVRDRLALLTLHEQIQKMLDRGELNLAQAKVILDLPEAGDQVAAAKLAAKLQLDANQLKGRTQHLKGKLKDKPERKKRMATFKQVSGGLVKLFDLVDEVDWSAFKSDQRETVGQQIDALVELLRQCQQELGVNDSQKVGTPTA